MDFGAHSVQILVSVIVVLAAAGMALVCDMLKGSNERLRELTIELKVRNEEAERRIQLTEKKSKRTPDLSSIRPIRAATSSPSTGSRIAAVTSKIQVNPEPIPQPMRVSEVGAASTASELSPLQRPARPRREMSAAVAAVAQSAAAIVNQERPEAAVASVEHKRGEELSVPATPPPSTGSPRRKNWDSILKRQGSLIPFESIREAVPAGYHDASILQRAVESGRVVSGLIVAIGAQGLTGERVAEVATFLKSLLGTQDFACQSGNDEFVMICSGDQGAAAQRRLSAIAEQLWDFQLSSIGSLTLQFTWGSFEAHGERISEAVASAIEQMQETRHARRGAMAKAV